MSGRGTILLKRVNMPQSRFVFFLFIILSPVLANAASRSSAEKLKDLLPIFGFIVFVVATITIWEWWDKKKKRDS